MNLSLAQSWKCKEKGCNSTITVDEEFLTVTREPSQHKDHDHPETIRVKLMFGELNVVNLFAVNLMRIPRKCYFRKNIHNTKFFQSISPAETQKFLKFY